MYTDSLWGGRWGWAGGETLVFVPMDPENLPVSTVCVSTCVCLQAGLPTCKAVGMCVCVRVYMVRHVCTDVCRSAGAERLSVCECVQVQEWACGCVWRQVVWACRGLLLRGQCVYVRVCMHVDARAGVMAPMPGLWTGGGRAVRVDLGHSVLSLGQLGPLRLRGLLPTTPFGVQSKASLLCLSLLPHRTSPSLSCSLWPDRQQLHGGQRAGVLGGLSEPHAFP